MIDEGKLNDLFIHMLLCSVYPVHLWTETLEQALSGCLHSNTVPLLTTLLDQLIHLAEVKLLI